MVAVFKDDGFQFRNRCNDHVPRRIFNSTMKFIVLACAVLAVARPLGKMVYTMALIQEPRLFGLITDLGYTLSDTLSDAQLDHAANLIVDVSAVADDTIGVLEDVTGKE